MSAAAQITTPLEEFLHQQILDIIEEEDKAQAIGHTEGVNVVPPSGMVTYSELRSCFELSRLVDEESVDLTPTFQRSDVWKLKDKAKFIDSLAKELPIPSLCFAFDTTAERWIVVDGKQRITAIHDFLGNQKLRLPNSEEIMPELAGKTHDDLRKENPKIFNKIKNLIIPITTIRVDFSRKDHLGYLSLVFNRLNQGGVKINAQEIRNAIYNSPYISMLRELADDSFVKEVISIDNKRQALTEMMVRFFAFKDSLHQYDGKLAIFLDGYLAGKVNMDEEAAYSEAVFLKSVLDEVKDKVLGVDFQLRKSKVLLDALLYGVSKNLEFIRGLDSAKVQSRVNELLRQNEFQKSELSDAIFSKDKVVRRLNKAALFLGPRYGTN